MSKLTKNTRWISFKFLKNAVISLLLPFLFLNCSSKNQKKFTNGGTTLSAEVATQDGLKITTVKDDKGVILLITTLDKNGVIVEFPNSEESTFINFSTPIVEDPTDFAAQHLAIYIAGQIYDEDSSLLRKDSPGCDWFPDTQCTLGCCAQHDRCYDDNNCSASSWFPILGSDACDNCNDIVASCIARGCSNDDENGEHQDQCYDNTCNAFFTCDDPSSCDCASPCTPPISCGNGTCEVMETLENCFADCVEGAGTNQCCASTSNCPSETEFECIGDCCCCGYGETCSETSVCAPGDPFLSTGLNFEAKGPKKTKTPKPSCQ